jgi:F-type H+-transporting ATPase subunit b
MGQLFATFGINPTLLLTQAVNFAAAMFVLWYFLYKPLLKVLAERREKIAKGVADAEAAAKAKEETEKERSGILSAAEKEAEAVVARATEEGKTEGRALVKNAQGQSDTILADARAQAEELKRTALSQSEKDIARMAVLAAEKILKQS